MTFVVTDKCVNCKYTDCVEVCPVDCFHEGPNFLVINPEECIDCGLCEPECPVEAIVSEDDLTEEDLDMLDINREYSERWPVIDSHKENDKELAEQWEGKPNKRELIEDY